MTATRTESPAATGVMVKSGEPPAAPLSVPVNGKGTGSIVQLLHLAVEKGTPVEALEKLVALHERLADREAAQEFAAALAAFQAECPPIKKTSTASIVTKKGGSYKYTYAELDEIARVVNPILAKHGLSYGWDSRVEKDTLTCICTLRHVNGHSVTSNFTLPTQNESAMSAQQMVGAALTFAKRQTLSSVLGLTTTDDDPDTNVVDPTPVSEDQATELVDLIEETKTSLPRFLKHFGIKHVASLPRAQYAEAKALLSLKQGRAQ